MSWSGRRETISLRVNNSEMCRVSWIHKVSRRMLQAVGTAGAKALGLEKSLHIRGIEGRPESQENVGPDGAR